MKYYGKNIHKRQNMKPNHYLAIAVRLFAIVLFLYALRQSTMLVQVLFNGDVNGANVSALMIFATSFCPLVIAMLLWYFPSSVANSILKPEMNQTIEPMSARSTLTVIILAVGLFAFYSAAVDAVYWLIAWNMTERNHYSGMLADLSGEQKASMITTAIELVTSIAIILKAKSLSYRMLHLAK